MKTPAPLRETGVEPYEKTTTFYQKINTMNAIHLDKAITEILKNTYHGASTRHICNLIFEQRTDKFIIVPGREKMSYVYNRLAAMKKRGEVMSDYPGHWRIIEAKEVTLP